MQNVRDAIYARAAEWMTGKIRMAGLPEDYYDPTMLAYEFVDALYAVVPDEHLPTLGRILAAPVDPTDPEEFPDGYLFPTLRRPARPGEVYVGSDDPLDYPAGHTSWTEIQRLEEGGYTEEDFDLPASRFEPEQEQDPRVLLREAIRLLANALDQGL